MNQRLKKNLSYIMATVILLPIYAFAAPLIEDPDGAIFDKPQQVIDFINRIMGILASLAGILIVAMLVWAGFLYVTSGGSEEKVGKAKDALKAAIIGFTIVITSYALIYGLGWILGGGVKP